MKRNLTFTYCLNDDEVTVDATYWPAYAGCWYRKNGDPGDPPEPAEAEITSICKSNGDYINFETLTDEQQTDMVNQALLEGDGYEAPEPEEKEWGMVNPY
jgi:hypothetical protein